MSVIKNPITGRDKFVVTDNGVFDAITGRQIGIIENGVVKSITTGAAIATISNGSGGSVDLSFITAGAEDILEGKVGADAAGAPVVGSIPMKGAATITPGTADKTIAAGTYLTGVQTIKGDANLKAENIADGVELFGIPGTHKGGGAEFYKCAAIYGPYDVETVVFSGCPVAEADGEYLPTDKTTTNWDGTVYPVYANGKGWYYYYSEFGGQGISQNYTEGIKYSGSIGSTWYDWDMGGEISGMTAINGTATLDADVPKTWDGYKAVLSGGVYTFEDVLTEGLTYSNIKPQKNCVYPADCSMKLDWLLRDYPVNGLTFYAPLADDLTMTETGQTLTNKGAELTTVDGLGCAKFFGNENYSQIKAEQLNLCPGDRGMYTIGFNFRINSDQDGGGVLGIGVKSSGNGSYRLQFYTYEDSGKWYGRILHGNSVDHEAHFEIERDKWFFIAVTRNAKTKEVNVYSNGTLVGTFTTDYILGDGNYFDAVYLGCVPNEFARCYLNNVMVYNRALTEAEIGQLVDKFGE